MELREARRGPGLGDAQQLSRDVFSWTLPRHLRAGEQCTGWCGALGTTNPRLPTKPGCISSPGILRFMFAVIILTHLFHCQCLPTPPSVLVGLLVCSLTSLGYFSWYFLLVS